MLGKAPTRIVVTFPWAQALATVARHSAKPIRLRLLTLLASNDHGEDAGGFFPAILRALGSLVSAWVAVGNQVGQGCVIENAGGRVSDVEKDLVENAVRKIAVDEFTQLFG